MKYAYFLAAAGLASAAPGQPLRQRTKGLTSRNPAKVSPFRSSAVNHKTGIKEDTQYSGNWAGAVNNGNGWNYVVGTIVVPEVSGDQGSAASAWVGIDGDSCQSAILQTGLSFYADGSFDAWYEWIPDYSYSYDNFGVSVGDTVTMMVQATSTTSGVASLENETTGQNVQYTFTNPPSTLCEQNAEWIVEAFQQGGSQVDLADFGTITFTGATANGDNGQVNAGDGATVIDMSPDGGNTVLTNCGANGNQVTCQYTGGN